MLISIIVPVYNGEKYITRCIESLLKQTYINIEILVIDDGSTDQTVESVKKHKDQRIKLYTKPNTGVSLTRNYGIEHATGDLVMFVDADDFIDKDMVRKMVGVVEDKESTLVLCDNLELLSKGVEYRRLYESENVVIDRNEMIRCIASGKAGLVCSKLVSKKVIEDNNIRFDADLRVGEDQLFFLNIAQHVKQFRYIPEALYTYDRKNEKSATAIYQNKLIDNFIYLHKQIEEVFYLCELNNKEDKIILNNKIVAYFLHCLMNEVKNTHINGWKVAYQNIEGLLERTSGMLDEDFEEGQGTFGKYLYSYRKKASKIKNLKVMLVGKLLSIKNG